MSERSDRDGVRVSVNWIRYVGCYFDTCEVFFSDAVVVVAAASLFSFLRFSSFDIKRCRAILAFEWNLKQNLCYWNEKRLHEEATTANQKQEEKTTTTKPIL